jgi:hypothetical protein
LELRDHLKSIGIDKLIATKVQCFDNMTKMLVLSKTKGNVSNDKKSFQYSLLSSVVESPVVENQENLSLINIDKKRTSCKRSLKPKMCVEALQIPLSTFYRNSDVALTRRWKMKNLVDLETWSSILKREGYTNITSDVKKALIEWIVQHDNINILLVKKK